MAVRSIVTFFLGVAVIMDSLVEKNTATVGKLVVGLLLIGIPSMEDLVRLVRRRGLPGRREGHRVTLFSSHPARGLRQEPGSR